MKSPVTRFAPSPSGFLHLGNVRTALFSLLAALPAGECLLRMEDTDAERVAPRFEAAALDDLAWLGFAPYIDSARILRQSERTAIYEEHLARLAAQGRVYPCFCSEESLARERAQARARGLAPRYSGRCARLSGEVAQERVQAGERAAWRFRVPPAEEVTFTDVVRGPQSLAGGLMGDFVIRRAEGGATFFFTNAVDDALSGVTLVLRGEDHVANTFRQILILQALGLPVPRYGHLPLILDEHGAPLAKRTGAVSVAALRDEGFLPQALVNYLARLGAVIPSDALLSIEDLARLFDCDRIGRASAHYDRRQLVHWQQKAIAAVSGEELVPSVPPLVPAADRDRFIAAVRANIVFARELADWAEVLYGPEPDLEAQARRVVEAAGGGFFDAALTALGEAPPGELPARLKAAGFSGKRLFPPLRAALTGRLAGPELKDILALMPRAILMRRLQRYRTPCSEFTTP